MASPIKIYLFTYNLLQSFGWIIALYRMLVKFVETKSVNSAYASAGELICLLQKLAFLEVIHGAFGVVPSGVLNPLMQWGGRTHFLLAIVQPVMEVQELPSIFITFVAWSLTEVIRYTHYALNCVGSCPYWITYLRFTLFIGLYPIGIFPGEMWLMYEALPFIKVKNLYADWFTSLPFSYYDFVRLALPGGLSGVDLDCVASVLADKRCGSRVHIYLGFDHCSISPEPAITLGKHGLVLLLVYPFLWLKLYLHMFKQRRSKLHGHRKEE